MRVTMRATMPMAISTTALLVLTLGACGDDAADGGIGDAHLPDGEVADGADSAGDAAGDDSAEPADTSTPADASAPDGDTPDTTAPADADVSETSDVSDASDATDASDASDASDVSDATADTSEDAADSLEVVEPQCASDADCQPLGLIIGPIGCNAARCVDGQCVSVPLDCDDGDPCTSDGCDPIGGSCVHDVVAVSVGASTFTSCSVAMGREEALAACIARGEDLARIDDASEGVVAGLVAGAADVWVASSSPITCPQPRRVVLPQCVSLQDRAGDACVDVVSDCTSFYPFVCERRCDDGDPCTIDFVGVDGRCQAVADPCDDGDPCTNDACEAGVGCASTSARVAWSGGEELLECAAPSTFGAARDACTLHGGVIAFARDDAQRAALSAFAAKPGVTAGLWGPFQQPGGDPASWTWVDGVGVGLPPWCDGEPDNADGSEDCGEVLTGTFCANDLLCDVPRSFGCVVAAPVP